MVTSTNHQRKLSKHQHPPRMAGKTFTSMEALTLLTQQHPADLHSCSDSTVGALKHDPPSLPFLLHIAGPTRVGNQNSVQPTTQETFSSWPLAVLHSICLLQGKTVVCGLTQLVPNCRCRLLVYSSSSTGPHTQKERVTPQEAASGASACAVSHLSSVHRGTAAVFLHFT